MVGKRKLEEKKMKWVNRCICFGVKALAILAMGFAMTARAAGPDAELLRFLTEFRAPMGSPVKQGEWNGNLDACKALADKEGIPMIAIWSNEGCGHCKVLERALMSDTFNTWMKTSGMIFCFTCSEDGGKAQIQAGSYYYFCKGPQMLTNYPFVRFYWYQNGKKVIDYSIHGDKVDKQQGIKNGTYNYAGQVVIDYIMNTSGFGAYVPKFLGAKGGSFALTDTEGSHLEVTVAKNNAPQLAAPTLSSISVPLIRTNNFDVIATNYIQVAGGAKQLCRWAVNEQSKWVSVNVPSSVTAGSKVQILLLDDTQKAVGTNRIWVVNEPANAPINPYFVGEKTKDTLNFGEWTMDADVAKAKVKAATGNAYTLMVFSGPLWCPDCIGAEAMFTSAEFKTWAVNNQVALVHIDQGASNAQTGVPTLLSYVERNGGTANAVSGAAYLSRKGISQDHAQEVFARNYAYSNVTYTRPWVAARNPNPHAVLLRKDGTIAGRWNQLENSDRTTDWASNRQRFEDLLLLADGGDESSTKTYTTKLTYAVSTATTTSLQINENARVYKLAGDVSGKRVNFSADSNKVTISLITDVDKAAFTQTVLASGVQTLTYDFANMENDVFVQVEAYAGSSQKFTTSTVFETTLTSTVVIVPQESASTYTVPDGDTAITIELVKGEKYKLTGFGDVSSAFTYDETSGTYTATKGGIVELPVTAATVTYQNWKPGTIAFAEAEGMVLEVDGGDTFSVVRSGGSSGEVSIKVSMTEPSDRVKNWSDVTLTWADGEDGEKTFDLAVVSNDTYEGDTVVAFALSVPSGDVSVGTPASMLVTIYDRDEPTTSPTAFGESFIKGFMVSQSYPVYNVRNAKRVTIKRAEGVLPSGLTMKYDAATQAIILSGVPKSVGEYTVTYNITESREDGKHTTTDPIQWDIEVKDPTNINPYIATGWTRTVPVSDDAGHLAGLLTVTATKSNKVTAKFQGTESKTYSFSGGWNGLDEEGVITAEIVTKSGAKLTFALGADGACEATLEGVPNYFDGLSASCTLAATDEDFSPFKGYYTVQLPMAETENALANGSGYLTLTFTSASAVKSGRVSYAGLLPNGQSISGTSMFTIRNGFALLPIFRRTTYDVIGLQLTVAPEAASLHTEDNRLIVADEGSVPYWLYRNTSAELESLVPLGVYGGYYAHDESISDSCSATYGAGVEVALIAQSELNGNSRYGTIVSDTAVAIIASDSRIALAERLRATSLTFNKRTGIFSGVITLQTEIGTLRANYKGVMLPRWYDCDACNPSSDVAISCPFGAGVIYLTDRINGKSVKRGLPIVIDSVGL
ncbi:MAG: hypothetical protein J6U40_10125 [Kiritimatiellae bacterium]|nr:hypothetical protein [Kiritimatiellia bacterium]